MRITVIRALLAAALLLLLSGCGRDQVRYDFMEGCIQGGVSSSICKCIFGKMEGELREMHALSRVSMSEETQQRLMQASASCLRE